LCDWEAEEYAEHLLWVEAERARARDRPSFEKSPTKLGRVYVAQSEAVEA
jgi:hypothetical protein